MSFFSPKAELALVFDIGSSSVGAALVRLSHGGRDGAVEPVRILHFLREAIPYQEKIDADRLFKDMVDVLGRIHADIVKEGASHLSGTEFRHVNVRRAFYSFASPWSATQTKTLSIKKDKPFVFTHALLNDLMLAEDEKFKKDAIGSRRMLPEALSVIERRIIQTRLNGYDIKDPFGKSAKEADVSYFTGIVPRSVLDKTLEISHAAHISKNIKSFTFPLAAFGTLQNIFPAENDYIHLRVGGEISDVSIVEDGLITESVSFPKGQSYLVKKISEELGMTKEETLSCLALHAAGHAEDAMASRCEPVFARVSGEWMEELRGILERLQSGMFLPQKLFLVMDGSISSLYVKALSAEPQNKDGMLRAPFDVSLVDSVALKPVAVFSGEQKDAPLGLVAGFVRRIYESERK